MIKNKIIQQNTLLNNGKITIPKAIRDKLCLQAGDKFELVLTENNEILLRPITKNLD